MKLIVFADYHYVSDIYYGKDSDYMQYSDLFIKMKHNFHDYSIESIFQEDADYYISLGDLTNLGSKDEIDDIYNKIKKTGKYDKFIHVFGNHDLYTSSAEDLSSYTGQAYNYAIDTDYARLIFYVSAVDEDPVEWGGLMTEIDQAFLIEEIEKAGDKPVLIFSHHPVYDTVAKTRMEKHYIEPTDRVQYVLNSHEGPGLFIASHTHAESIKQKDNWTYVNIDAFLDHPKYSIINICQDEISVSSVEIPLNEDLDRQRQIIGSHMPYFVLRPLQAGTSLDREIKIRL